jgi:hypothetical protein
VATIDDLDITSIADMSRDEALELLRQLRLSRRTPKASSKKSTSTAVKNKQKSTMPALSPEQAAALLAMLEGN